MFSVVATISPKAKSEPKVHKQRRTLKAGRSLAS